MQPIEEFFLGGLYFFIFFIIMYKLAMHLAEDMKNRGIITDEEYVTIEQKMCEKFSINSTSIYRKMT